MNSKDTNIEAENGWFDKNRRKLSGIGYLIGDAALAIEGVINMRQGIKEGDKDALSSGIKELAVGGGFAIGGAAMAKYGKRPVADQLSALHDKLAAHFEKEGIQLSTDYVQRAKRENNKNFFGKIEDFCYKYPTEILNASYGLLSTLLISDGWKDFQKGKAEGKTNVGTLGMGILIMSGALAGLLIKEKTPKQLAEAGTTGIQATLQKNALAVTGGLYFANNFFTAKSSIERYNRYNKPLADPQTEQGKINLARSQSSVFKNIWMFRALTAASYVFSNLTLMGTKKGASGDANVLADARETLLHELGTIIQAQPKEKQTALIEQTAEYLSHQKEIGIETLSKEATISKLSEALEKHKPSPANTWVDKSSQVPSGSNRTV